MDHEHEEAMRAEFNHKLEIRAQAWRPSTTEAEMNELFARNHATNQRWLNGPHAKHWQYLDDAYQDWAARPETMTRFLDGIDHDRAGGYFVGVTDIEYRSQCQARDLTEAERARRQERPPRQRGRQR